MTAKDLRAWQKTMQYTNSKAAAALGVNISTFNRWLVAGTPDNIGLVCAAVAAGLGPWQVATPLC